MRYRCTIDSCKKISISVLFITTAAVLQWSCSTANEAGRCISYEAPKYVAAISDTDGKPWEIVVQPNVGDFTCDKVGASEIVFSAVVMDGQKQTKPAVAIQAVFSGLGSEEDRQRGLAGIYSNPANGNDDLKELQDDVATDACGVATFRFQYFCPEPRKSIGGSFFVQSGPLFSQPVKVTIENTVQDPPASNTTTTTPAAGAPAPGP